LGYGVNVDGQILMAPYLFSTTLLFIPPTVILRFLFWLFRNGHKSLIGVFTSDFISVKKNGLF
jgi:hypothetical protein